MRLVNQPLALVRLLAPERVDGNARLFGERQRRAGRLAGVVEGNANRRPAQDLGSLPRSADHDPFQIMELIGQSKSSATLLISRPISS